MRYICARISVFAFSEANTSAPSLCAWLRHVRRHSRKNKETNLRYEKSLTNCPLRDITRLFCNDRICWLSGFCLADNSSQIFKRKKLDFLSFRLWRKTTEICGIAVWRLENDFLTAGLIMLSGGKLISTRKKEKKNSLWQPERRKNPFRVVEKMLTRKKFRLLFSLFRQNFCISTATEREKNFNIWQTLLICGLKTQFDNEKKLFAREFTFNRLIFKQLKNKNYERLTHAYGHWRLTFILVVLLPHSLCRCATANAPALRQNAHSLGR